jgi:hypothetical protein|tara:strand:+ start:1762 stop:2100 length:339 start_codon:yes stop_codon:yes gene_type:complete
MPRYKIQNLTVRQLEPTEKGPQFLAIGTVRDLVSKSKTKPFVAKTVIYQDEPIFKVQDAGSLKDRKWKRGERISIARACKIVRLALEALEADADSASEEELEAAAEVLAAAK